MTYDLFKTLSNYSKNFLNCQADLHIRPVNLLIRRMGTKTRAAEAARETI
jgi:hypothetical protein